MISSCIPLAWARLPSWSCSASLVRHAVPGLVDGDAHCAVVDGLGRHGDGSLDEVDRDRLDPREPPTSPVTALTQCWQVMPSTVYVGVVIVVSSSALSMVDGLRTGRGVRWRRMLP